MRRAPGIVARVALAAWLAAWLAAGAAAAAPTAPSTSAPTSTAGDGSSATPPLPQATPRSVASRLSRPQPRLGEPFEWTIELRHAAAEAYSLPARLELAPFQATPGGCRRAAAGADSITTCTVRLALFELGAHDLPVLRLEASTPEGARALDVPGPRVEAAGVIDPKAPDEQLQLRPPAAAVPLLLPSWRVLWWTLAASALLAAGWLAWRWWRRRAARAAEPPPPLPPGERLARRLDALASERLPEQGRAREYFFSLTEAVREYLAALTGVNALELTTAELCDALGRIGDPRLDLETLRAFSEDADLVKFARFPAGMTECDAGMRVARTLLERTRAPTATATGGPA